MLPQELQSISQLFQTEAYKDTPTTGIVIEGVKYIVPRVEDNLVFGKKNKSGVFLVKTNQGKRAFNYLVLFPVIDFYVLFFTAVIIVLYNGDTTEGLACRSAVERVAQYLQGQGYWKANG